MDAQGVAHRIGDGDGGGGGHRPQGAFADSHGHHGGPLHDVHVHLRSLIEVQNGVALPVTRRVAFCVPRPFPIPGARDGSRLSMPMKSPLTWTRVTLRWTASTVRSNALVVAGNRTLSRAVTTAPQPLASTTSTSPRPNPVEQPVMNQKWGGR